jgi:hypothetical protein
MGTPFKGIKTKSLYFSTVPDLGLRSGSNAPLNAAKRLSIIVEDFG